MVFSYGAFLSYPCEIFSGRAENPPAVFYEKRFDRNVDLICLFGFPVGETVAVNLYDPQGKLVASIPKTIQEVYPLGDGTTVNIVSISPIPNHATPGVWRIVVKTKDSRVEGELDHPDERSDLTISKAVPDGTGWIDPRRLSQMRAGETLLVSGVNYDPGAELPLAIYQIGQNNKLIAAQNVTTDPGGNFIAGFTITNQYPPGSYNVLVITDPERINYPLLNFNDSFQVYQPKQVCQGAMPTFLKAGDTVLVNGGPANNVREKAGLNYRKLGQIKAYEEAQITAGPKCADGMVWWKIYSTNTGLDGWTAEGKNGDYWLSLLHGS